MYSIFSSKWGYSENAHFQKCQIHNFAEVSYLIPQGEKKTTKKNEMTPGLYAHCNKIFEIKIKLV